MPELAAASARPSAGSAVCTGRGYPGLRFALGAPAGEEAPLGGQRGQLQRALVGRGGLGAPSQPPQEIRPRGVEQVVAVERAVASERVDQVQPLRRAVRHRHRDRLVQRHHRAGLDAAELGVEQRDLAPVGRAGPRRLRVDRGDRRLERVRARRPPQRERAVDERQRLADHRAVPALAILLLEQHEVAVRADPCRAPRVVEEHQREQPGRLRLVGQQQVDDPGEPDRLRREVLAHDRVARGRGVALVEDQVEHREHGGEPVRRARRAAARRAGCPTRGSCASRAPSAAPRSARGAAARGRSRAR